MKQKKEQKHLKRSKINEDLNRSWFWFLKLMFLLESLLIRVYLQTLVETGYYLVLPQ